MSDQTLILKPIQTKSFGWRVLKIELEETSGPVAPEFRSDLNIQLLATQQGFYFQRSESKGKQNPKFKRIQIDEDTYASYMKDLLNLGIHNFETESYPKNPIMGISYNSVKFTMGGKSRIFYYRLQDLENPKRKHKNDIILYLKRIQ
jgi:hypothetical protein